VRARYALGPVLVALLVIATTAASTVAREPGQPPATQTFTPLTLSMVSDAAGAGAATVPTIGPAPASLAGDVILEDPGAAPVPELARRAQPAPVARIVVKRIQPVRYTARTRHSISGPASWYCNSNAARGPISSGMSGYPDTGGFNAYAAAGPGLRAALGSGWRGRIVSVDGLRVKLVDWCQCYQGQANEKLIDLYRDVYDAVGGTVTIRW
jgi:hypothetical protein